MAPSWRSATLAPFKSRIFLAIWTASLVSNLGSLIQAVGAAWLMISIAPSANMVALVQSFSALPLLLLSLPAGAIADLWDRRLIMLASQGMMFIVSAVLAVMACLDRIEPWTLLFLTFLLGCGAALNGPAWQAAVGEQVSRDHVPAAVSLNALAFNLARTFGPAIGGIIVATSGPKAAFVVNATTYVGLLVVLGTWRRQVPKPVLPPESMPMAMQAGLRYVLLSPAIGTVVLRGFFFGSMGGVIWALMPVIARDLLHGGALTYGMMFGAFGIGAVIGALGTTALRQRLSSESIIILTSVAFGLATVSIAVSSWFPVTLLLMMIDGACWVITLSILSITVQVSSPRWVVGRALAIHQMIAFGGLAAGSWLFGEISKDHGIAVALIAGGAGMLLTVLLGVKWKLPPAMDLNLDPFRKTPQLPNMNAEVVPQSGPVVVTVQYKVAAEDRDEFMAAMRELRRIRRRDGGQRWILLQDVDDPTSWTERFQTPTWLDYLRQRERFTMADSEVAQRVRELHRGEGMPKVKHFIERTPTLASHRKSPAEQISERASVVDPNLPPAAMPVLASGSGHKESRS